MGNKYSTQGWQQKGHVVKVKKKKKSKTKRTDLIHPQEQKEFEFDRRRGLAEEATDSDGEEELEIEYIPESNSDTTTLECEGEEERDHQHLPISRVQPSFTDLTTGFAKGDQCKKFKFHADHYIPFSDLDLNHLPESIRHPKMLDYLIARGNMVVKIEVSVNTNNFHRKAKGTLGSLCASGYASLCSDTAVRGPCPVKNCSYYSYNFENDNDSNSSISSQSRDNDSNVSTSYDNERTDIISVIDNGYDKSSIGEDKYKNNTIVANISSTQANNNIDNINTSSHRNQTHEVYGGILVTTNKHVIMDDTECQSAKFYFFYNNDDDDSDDDYYYEDKKGNNDNNSANSDDDADDKFSSSNNDNTIDNTISNSNRENTSLPPLTPNSRPIGYGLSLRDENGGKDYVGAEICLHDTKMFDHIRKFSEDAMLAWDEIPEHIRHEFKKRTAVISHPHGLPKQVSFGDLLSKEEINNHDDTDLKTNIKKQRNKNHRESRYTSLTCTGSSGAPVLTGSYWNNPFVHSTGKYPVGDQDSFIGKSFYY